MAVLDDFVPVVPNQTDVSSGTMVLPQTPVPFAPENVYQEQPTMQQQVDNWASQPASVTAKVSPITFDWEKSNADRYVQDRHLKELGFEPYGGTEIINDKPYDLNELRYGAVQTFGDVMSKAAGGFVGITAQSFTESWHGTGRLLNAIFGAPWSDQTFKERLVGTPEELADVDREQKAIFNKYAIYHTPESDNSTLNKQFLGDIVQQMGFTVGTAAEFLVESALTWGIGEGVSAALKGSKWATAGADIVSQSSKTIPLAERINDARKVSDISKNTTMMESFVEGSKNLGRWSAKQLNPLAGIDDIMKLSEAGASKGQLAIASVGAAKRLFSQVNMAATESRFEAAGTFGQMYGDLIAKYQDKHNGQQPIGQELEDIRTAAYGASTDNFIVNTGLLMAMNQIESGNMFSKFSSSSKLLRGALEAGDKEAFTVAGKVLGKESTKVYERGTFGALGKFGSIRRDFGLGTALWQVAKRSATGTAAKFEITEGIQEILQNTSDNTLRDYYTNLYDGSKDLHGASILDADWSKGLSSQYNRDGWKTFLMGAVTGLAMSPLQASLMYGTRKGYSKINDQYKGQVDEKKKTLQDNIETQNSFYKDIGKALNEKIGNTKIQGTASKNIEEAIASGDKYLFNNSKDDALTKAVAAAIKTDNYESLVGSIKDYAEHLTEQEIKDAFPGLTPTTQNKELLRNEIEKVAQDIEDYHDNWERLKDQFSHLIMPELYKGDPARYSQMLLKKRVLDEAIEILATTSAKATKAITRAAEIKDKNGQVPHIGGSINTAYDIFSNEKQLGTEIMLLQQEIAVYDSLGRDPGIRDEKQNARERLKHLKTWANSWNAFQGSKTIPIEENSVEHNQRVGHLNALKKSFDGFVIADYQQSPTAQTTIDTSSLHQAFNDMGDYIALNRDGSQYIEALNVLKDPKNFKTLTERVQNAMLSAKATLVSKSAQESADIIGEEDGEQNGTKQGQQEEGQEQGQQQEIPINLETDLLNHYTKNTEQSIQVSAYLKKNKQLARLLDALIEDMPDDPDGAIIRMEEAIHNHFRAAEDNDIPVYTSDLAYAPVIAEVNGQWRVSYGAPVGTKDYKTKKEANKALKEYIKEQSKAGGKFELFKLGDRQLQRGQKLYRQDGTEIVVNNLPNEKGELVIRAPHHIIITDKSIGDWYNTPEEATQAPVIAANNKLERDRERPETIEVDGEVEAGSANKLRWDDMHSIIPYGKSAGDKTGETKLTNKLLNIPQNEFNTMDLYITIEPEKNKQGTLGNPIISGVRSMNTGTQYRVSTDAKGKSALFYVMDNSNRYQFNVERDGKTVEVFAKDLTPQEMWKFFNPPASYYDTPVGNKPTLTELYKQFQDELTNIRTFYFDMSKKGQGTVISPNDVHKLLQFSYITKPVYSGPNTYEGGKVYPKVALSDILTTTIVTGKETLTHDEDGLPTLVINNSSNEKYQANKPFFGGTSDPSGKLLRSIQAIAPYTVNNNEGMAAVPIGLPNGNIVWAQLSPRQMSVEEVNSILQQINTLITSANGQPNREVEGDTKPINDLLKRLFIAFNVYETGKVDYSKKFSLKVADIQDSKSRYWHTTLFISPTFGDNTTKKELATVRRLDKVQFANVQEFVDSLNKALKEKIKGTDKLKSKHLENLYVTPDSFKEQVNVDDMSSIMKMTTNLSLNNGLPVNIDIKWQYKSDQIEVKRTGTPAIKEQVPIDNNIAESLLSVKVKSSRDFTPDQRVFIGQLVTQGLLENKNKNAVSIVKAATEKYLKTQTVGIDTGTQQEELEHESDDNPSVPVSSVDDGIEENIDKYSEQQKRLAQAARAGRKKKVIPDTQFDSYSIENIDKFQEWAANNLPVAIQTDVANIVDNLKNGNVTVGQFLFQFNKLGKVSGGKITVGEKTPFKYHEAFHAVFNLLLSDSDIDKYLQIAKKENPVTDKKIDKFLADNPEYIGRDMEFLEDMVAEEYLADIFDKWKTDRSVKTSSVVKGLFAKLVDWIKEIWAKLTGSDILGLFHEIDRGKYRNSDLQDNQFTRAANVSVTLPKNKVIQVGWLELPDGTVVPKTLPQQTADALSAAIAGLFVNRLENDPQYQQKGSYNKNKILDSILDQYRDLLDWRARKEYYEKEAKRNISDPVARKEWEISLHERYLLFKEKEGRDKIKESVNEYLNVMGLRQELEDDMMSADESEYGPVNTEKLERESAFNIGGQDSLPSQIRKLIGAVTYPISETPGKHDEFFNKTFLDDTPIVQAVSAGRVYNGMMKLMANISGPDMILRKLCDYIDQGDNPETIRFINSIFTMTGFDPVVYKETNYTVGATKNHGILQQVIKAFNQYSVNSKFVAADLNNNEYSVIDANSRDAAFYTMGQWQNAFNDKFYDQYTKRDTKKFVSEATHPLRILKQYISGSNTKITDTDLQEVGKELSTELNNRLGITVHPSYIRYSILKNKKPNKISAEQQVFINGYSNVDPIAANTIDGLLKKLESNNKNLFARTEKGVETSVLTLDKWATGNAIFDENVSMLNHTTADGKQMSNYVAPYLLGVSVGDMNTPDWLDKLSFRTEVADNPLIGSEEFGLLRKQGILSVDFIDGIREVGSKNALVEEYNKETDTYEGTGDTTTELYGIGAEGATYKDMTSREFLITLLSMYNVSKQPGTKVYREDGSFFYNIPVPVRVPSEKGMFGLVKLSVIHSITKQGDNIQLTEQALEILCNRIQFEFDRIKEVQQQIDNGPIVSKQAIKNWNTGDLRGLKLFVTSKMVGGLRTDIEKLAREGGELTDIKDQIDQQLNSYFLSQANLLADRLVDRGLIEKTEEGYENILAPTYLFDGLNTGDNDTTDSKMYLQEDDFIRNLAQVFMNSYLNTTMLNNLIHGDESKLYKNAADIVKRESGTMAVLKGIDGVTAAPTLGINHALRTIHHLTYTDESVKRSLPGSNKPLDTDDGEMYHTEKGLRYILYGKGTLNSTQVRILNDLSNGRSVSADDIFNEGGLKDAGAFTALKLVYNDGQVYLKCSSITLFKELTSYKTKENGKTVWKPRLGKEELHTLREKMEQFESRNPTSIAFAHPTSASKMLTKNVVSNINTVTDEHFEPLQARFMGEQLQNPSGKVVITDPTQAKGQIMNELDDTTPVYYMGSWTDSTGKPYTVGHLKNIYLQQTAKRINNNWVTARDGLFQIDSINGDIQTAIATGKVTPQLGKFIDHARKNLEATGTDNQLLDFMRVEDGKPVYNINFPSILPKITQIFFSYFSGGILRERVPGMSLALVSPAKGLGSKVKQVTAIWTEKDIKKYQPILPDGRNATELIGQPRIWRVIPDSEYDRSPDTYKNAIRFNNKNDRLFYGLADKLNTSEPVYIVDDLRDNYLHFDNGEPIGYFTEALRPAHFREEMSGIPGSMKKSFGTRIPSVDKNSYSAFMFVDTLPAYMGSILVTAREYYERTGADNDIDKDYVSIPDTYSEKGKRVAYGTATTYKDKMIEWVKYQMSNPTELKKLVKQYLENDNSIKEVQDYLGKLKGEQAELVQQYADNEKFLKDPEGYNELFKSAKRAIKTVYRLFKEEKVPEIKEAIEYLENMRDMYIMKSLEELGLPDTVDRFITAGGENLNNGVLNNQILAAKIGMLNNKHTIQNNNTLTTTAPIQEYIRQMSDQLADSKSEYGKMVRERMLETDVDTNSFIGMDTDRNAFMIGAQSIGSIATTNIVYSFLNANNIGLRSDSITIDGHTYGSFGNSKAWDGKSYNGERIFSTLGAITNVMTDNPKERDAGKLNLDKTATEFVGYLIASGMPKETALWYALQPAVSGYLNKKIGYTIQTEEEKNSYVSAYIKEQIQELEDQKVKPKKKGLTQKDLIDNIKNDGKNLSVQLTVLLDLQKMEKQSETMFRVARIVRLMQGFQPNMEDFDQVIEDLEFLGVQIKDGKLSKVPDKEFKEMDVVVDVRDALLSDNKIIATILQSVNELNSMMPSMFLERTNVFSDMSAGVNNTLINAPKSAVKGAKYRRTLKYDLISSLMLRAYKYWLSSVETPSTADTTLKNSLIYDNENGILKLREELMSKLTEQNINNYLLTYFLVPRDTSEETGGINLLEANTWTKLSLLQQQRLIGSFADLYTNAYQKEYGIDTHEFAQTLFNYLLVKDGGQFANGSFIKMLPAFVFKNIMDTIGDVNTALYKKDRKLAEKEFGPGIDSTKLLNDYMRGYSTHIGNKKYIGNLYIQQDIAVTRTEESQKNYNKLTTAEKTVVDTHQAYNGNKVIGLNIDPVTKQPTVQVDIFGGIRAVAVAKPHTKMESVMFQDNLQYLDSRGMKRVEGGGVSFPWSYNYKGTLYTLQEIHKKDKSGNTYIRRGDFIERGENSPQGIKAIYAPAEYRGSTRQFRSASAIDEVPVYKPTKREESKQATAEAIEVLQDSDYQPREYTVTTTNGGVLTRLGYLNAQGDILKNEYGRAVATPIDAARAIENRKNTISSAKPVVSSQLTPAQWKDQLTAIYNSNKLDKSLRDWMQDAIDYRDAMRRTTSDTDIMNEIKECPNTI